jgi:hypothetical protein
MFTELVRTFSETQHLRFQDVSVNYVEGNSPSLFVEPMELINTLGGRNAALRKVKAGAAHNYHCPIKSFMLKGC